MIYNSKVKFGFKQVITPPEYAILINKTEQKVGVCMPVIDKKFSPEALRNIQGPRTTLHILLSKLFRFEFPFHKSLTLETLP